MAKYSLNLDKFMEDNKDASYQELMDIILEYQMKMCEVDTKARNAYSKKNLSKTKKEEYNKLKQKVRQEVIEEMESKNVLEKVLKTISNISKAVKSLAKLMVYMISALFSVEGVEEALSNETKTIIQQIYDKSMKIYKFL
jgi:hypothetical protein|nr:MAG TPA: hypothetical protein [Caudoviricetes sp.]